MRKKLLLAEDSVTMQKVFEMALAKSEISVIAVDNGHDAIRLVEEIAPDLVVADVTLSGVDGYGVASAIRETEAGKTVPILILAGVMAPPDDERVKACGAKGILLKPFEYRELLEKVEGLVGEAAHAPGAPAPPEPPPADEHWDFTDVLDEAEGVIPSGRAGEPAQAGDPVFPARLPSGLPKDEPAGLNEYDVSLEEIEEPAPVLTAAAPAAEPSPPAAEEIPVRAAHLEGSVEEDAPPAVTDLPPAVQEPEEIEEIQDFHEIEMALPEAPAAEPVGTEPVAAEPSPVAEPVALEPAPAVEPAAPEAPPEVPQPVAASADEAAALAATFKEQFAARAEEIFRAVATEAVEKATWEMMDRLAAEFSEKLRESIEAVAWEVIPATAETLIRDEIARIRRQVGKPSH